MTALLNRRAALFGAAVSTAALAVPAAAAVARPVYVKVGSPSFSVSPEVMAARALWNKTQDAKALAWQAYEATFRGLTRQQVDLGAEEAGRLAWLAACEEADLAQLAMLKLLRVTDLDLKTIYRVT